MLVLITFVAVNDEEMLKEDFASTFASIKAVAERTKSYFKFISWACIIYPRKC